MFVIEKRKRVKYKSSCFWEEEGLWHHLFKGKNKLYLLKTSLSFEDLKELYFKGYNPFFVIINPEYKYYSEIRIMAERDHNGI